MSAPRANHRKYIVLNLFQMESFGRLGFYLVYGRVCLPRENNPGIIVDIGVYRTLYHHKTILFLSYKNLAY